MTSFASSARARESVGVLRRAAAAVVASLPLAMAIAHRSAPLILVLAALLALAAEAADDNLRAMIEKAKTAVSSDTGIAALAFLGFALLSVAWSPSKGTSLFAFGEFVLPLAAALVLAIALPRRSLRFALPVFAASVAAACAFILFELATGMVLHRLAHLRINTFIFNRSVLSLLVLLPPLLLALARSGQRWRAVGLGALVACTVLWSDSGAGALGLIAGTAGYLVARWFRTAALWIAVAAVVAATALAPIAGDMLDRLMPQSLHERLSGTHSQARVDIWRGFGAAVREAPWIGSGFAPGPSAAQSPAAMRIDPAYRVLLAVGHTHNAALQIWAELGSVGAFLALAVLCLMLRRLAHGPPERFAPALALFAGAASVSLVGHGLWQGWWAAVIGAAIVWFGIVDHEEEEAA